MSIATELIEKCKIDEFDKKLIQTIKVGSSFVGSHALGDFNFKITKITLDWNRGAIDIHEDPYTVEIVVKGTLTTDGDVKKLATTYDMTRFNRLINNMHSLKIK